MASDVTTIAVGLCLIAVACGGRTQGGAEGTTSTTDTAATSTTSATGSETSGAEGEGTDSDDEGQLLDFMPPPSWWFPDNACALEWPSSSSVAGTTDLGDFVGARAYFGIAQINGMKHTPVIVILAGDADLGTFATEAENDDTYTGPALALDGPLLVDVPGAEDGVGRHWVDHFGEMFEVRVQVDQLLGNWDEFDPNDPPRLAGSLGGVGGQDPATVFAGDFEAVYCGYLNEFVIAE